MKNIPLVIKHEIVTMLSKRSFWLTTCVFPVFILLITFGSQLLATKMIADSGDQALIRGEATPAAAAEAPQQIGYVDEAGLIVAFPDAFPRALLRPYPDAAAAQADLQAGALERYYLIPADYAQTGAVQLVDSEYTPFSQFAGSDVMEYLLRFNIAQRAAAPDLILDPLPNLVSESILPPEKHEPGGMETLAGDEFLKFIVPYAVLLIFFMVITMSSGYMLQSVSKEKENRVAEVLLLSLRPRELMAGKLVGLGLTALLQMLIWLGGSLLALERGKALFEIAKAIVLPPGFLAWGLLYLLLGYLLYSAMMAAIGALAPNSREVGPFTFMALLPLMLPLWLMTTFIEAPNGPLAVALSLFPFSAPVSMMTRMVMGQVPLWQLLVSLSLLAATAYGLLLLSARFFRADTLLSEMELNWKRVWREIKGLRRA